MKETVKVKLLTNGGYDTKGWLFDGKPFEEGMMVDGEVWMVDGKLAGYKVMAKYIGAGNSNIEYPVVFFNETEAVGIVVEDEEGEGNA